jgi:hypothetical protein
MNAGNGYYSLMRVSTTLDADVYEGLKAFAASHHLSLKASLDSLLRTGLAELRSTEAMENEVDLQPETVERSCE